jgi:AbrB family looped-hinge helix DNA binding protein
MPEEHSFMVEVDRRFRITIPSTTRTVMGIEEGDILILEVKKKVER